MIIHLKFLLKLMAGLKIARYVYQTTYESEIAAIWDKVTKSFRINGVLALSMFNR